MPVEFRYAQIEINQKPVLVDKQTIADASLVIKDGLARVTELTEAIMQSGFALQTPEGMQPIVLGNALGFSKWLSETLGASFDLGAEIRKLPPPLSTGLNVLAGTDLVLYSAALFYIPKEKRDTDGKIKAMYGEIVFGFRVNLTSPDFPLGLNEIVIAVNNFPAAA